MPDVDASFLAMPARGLAAAALERAAELGADHADFRLERIRSAHLGLRDGELESSGDSEDVGLAVRVVHQGAWGFAGGLARTAEAARDLADAAVETARVARPLTARAVELAPEEVYDDVTWVSDYEIDPFTVPAADRVARLRELSERLLASDGVDHVDARLLQVIENKFYADSAGTMTTQQRVRVHPEFTAYRVDRGSHSLSSMRTLAPPVGRGWEYLTGTGWDFDAEIDELPGLLAEHAKAPGVEPGRYDLVIAPSNLWLTIHESIGHATELDRALGYEAAYAGTTFATPDQLGSLRYGSPGMHVTGDRTVPHGLATIGWDDEGVPGQQFDLIDDGVLVGYQLDRDMARANADLLGEAGGRSNGCSFADSPAHIPLQRMANVSLQPDPDGPSLDGLIGDVERGILILGDRSWSIDMQRYNFQFTGQQFHRIENGRLAGQLRDVAYQATTTEFWGSMARVGGPQTWELHGAMNCGKGQPGQVAAVSHGAPAALFRGVNVLNTRQEGGR
ncbi:TldD/PmbA family protein [Jatrophihabitans endophyticus]|uniref:TldD/PmbA family protein n=1 Tax=Jatrophihabitans endophyticus TaxID=1206085 RepID=UPI0019E5EB45|nr:TldD/PmbA family protein [Jatrophihabitans endophyticus]MBE7189872.1 TldD/PmbA family protein [Jatrophihabitans endophyticus]